MSNGACQRHGGKSLKAAEHPNFRTGEHVQPRYKGLLPPGLLPFFEASESDSEAGSLRLEIALLDTRAKMLQEQIANGESGGSWKEALQLCEDFIAAQIVKDRPLALKTFKQLHEVLKSGAHLENAWTRLETLAWTKRPKLLQADAKLRVARAEVVQMAWVVRLCQSIWASVERNVKDDNTRKAIEADYLLLTGGVGQAEVPSE